MENKEIYEDRWLSWFFAVALSVAIVLWGAAQYTIIQMEDYTSDSIYRTKSVNMDIIPEVKDGTCNDNDLECLSSFYKHEILGYGRVLDVKLETGTGFSGGSLVVNGRDGRAFYFSQNGKKGETAAKGKFSINQMASLASLIEEKDLLSMESTTKPAGNGGSNYKITVRILSSEKELKMPEVYSASCVFPNCGREFLEIKDTIMEFWGDAFICLDGCNIEENS